MIPTLIGPLCPASGAHGPTLRRTKLSKQADWCGTWYDCSACKASVLVPSQALIAYSAQGRLDSPPLPVEPERPALRSGETSDGYAVMYPNPGTTLQESREWLRAHYTDRGARCPVCKQVAREYRRTIHAAMAEKLIQFWRAYGTMTWGERTPLMLKGRPGAADGGGDFAKLRYWDLIEEADDERQDGGRAGWWRVTQLGARFVQNEYAVHRYAYVYDGVCRRVDGELWNIQRCLGKRFDYNTLIGHPI